MNILKYVFKKRTLNAIRAEVKPLNWSHTLCRLKSKKQKSYHEIVWMKEYNNYKFDLLSALSDVPELLSIIKIDKNP